jgi:hypothetical protein
MLIDKCTKLERDREKVMPLLRESDMKLVSARREEVEMYMFVKNAARENNKYILRSEHAML